ncbi:MAG: HIT family protein [bacterium]
MCIFCKIINNEIPSYKIYEDNNVLAILDISQITYGHTLVIPKKHYENIFDIEEVDLLNIMKVVNNLSKQYKDKLNIEGINIFNNSGEIAGQEVNHFHFHIVPRYAKEELTIKHSSNKYNLEEVYNKLK